MEDFVRDGIDVAARGGESRFVYAMIVIGRGSIDKVAVWVVDATPAIAINTVVIPPGGAGPPGRDRGDLCDLDSDGGSGEERRRRGRGGGRLGVAFYDEDVVGFPRLEKEDERL